MDLSERLGAGLNWTVQQFVRRLNSRTQGQGSRLWLLANRTLVFRLIEEDILCLDSSRETLKKTMATIVLLIFMSL